MKRFAFLFLSLFVATSAAAANGNYLIQPGDTIRIEVLEDATLNRTALVLPDGKISFPFAGTVTAAGRTLSQVERAVTAGIASNFASEPTVYVSVANLAPAAAVTALTTVNIYVLGEINGPGLVQVEPGTTLLQALAQTGGFTKFAATKRVQLRRRDPNTGAEKVYKINYRALSQGAAVGGNVVLAEGDVILVPERRLFE
ncbi:MAG: sugar transporter [Confluentimicrobium sp.]|jgi:polysaccharide biosynthesis/export protein|uniref:Polysaccharide export outer membrane protein n=1 Tax=Actibacterium naphthalenivorans TaxID=1614693 RepID=A0A840C6K6_9RHOB|nr:MULTISPECIES: polysaccharide biosynthesis/export family protein [Actibacterium]KGB83658.1 sugar transporter [Rhodovulum sp. NI22]MDY6860138.1 polysaccharide biosynthesis/export family protein [Pseudomonadota bacterium]ALG88948.1 sugar transporter [Actibacterium sp. EMB200-NS6]MBB4021514.1 polysaccharide export outer membrane protein [Actibacterium naphthalenivorans]MBC56973.1 sugar transporter [Actibacterium sp.]|tara:strand:- start:1155 stop:1754 length:600 start_codon:yes stop_codon:yes gene_type:complete